MFTNPIFVNAYDGMFCVIYANKLINNGSDDKWLDCRTSTSCTKLCYLTAYSMKSMFQNNITFMQYYGIQTAVQIV